MNPGVSIKMLYFFNLVKSRGDKAINSSSSRIGAVLNASSGVRLRLALPAAASFGRELGGD